MALCDSCHKNLALFPSTGGITLCHKCAHDFGLLHRHPNLDDTTHVMPDFGATEKELEAHMKKYPDHPFFSQGGGI